MPERNQRGMSTQDTILAALADLVLLRPYSAFSVNEVNMHAGVSKTQFYHHFTSKDGAAAEFVRLENARMREHVHRQIDSRTSSIETLAAGVLEMTGYLRATRRFRAALIVQTEIGRDRSLQLDLFDDWQPWAVERVTSAVAAGDMRPDVDPAKLVMQLLALWNGLRILAETTGRMADLPGMVADALRLHLASAVVEERRAYLDTFISRYADRIAHDHPA